MNGPELIIETTAPEATRRMERWFAKQVPFATARALTRTAKRGQAFVRGRLGQHFKVRRKTLGNAVQISPARKADWPYQEARVGIMFDWLAHHVTGATRRARDHRLSIPTRKVQKLRTTSGAIPKRLRAKSLIPGKRAVIEDDQAHRPLVLFTGKGRVALGTQPSVVYLLRQSAKIDRRWPFQEEVSSVVKLRLHREFLVAMRDAANDGGGFLR